VQNSFADSTKQLSDLKWFIQMYNKFFAFKEKPFMLAPNPAYLFLGKSHEEALAHLIYAISEGEGFISITGERGVGKTTICRAFIDRRDDNTEIAYIFKPELSPEELLKKINFEFGIRKDTDDIKEFIDAFNTFLMQKRVEDKRVVLLIDEAQNLREDALEQVRLLSNLETTREKLLQIVLVGEPKLAEMLDSRALRQIGQRVSVSYYIRPLTYEETCAYIYHRMSIASLGDQTHFEASALKRIFKFSGGIPRMINIACDKSLFAAYRLKLNNVTGEIVRSAILDLTGSANFRWFAFLNPRRALLIGLGFGLLAILMMVIFYPQQTNRQDDALNAVVRPAIKRQPPKPKVNPLPRTAPEPTAKPNRESMPKFTKTEKLAAKPTVLTTSSPVSEKGFELTAKMSYSVQVGAFLSRNLAQMLVGTLRQKGYPAIIFEVTDPKTITWHTVRIGDFSSREAAIQKADEFTSREKMESAVRPFEKL